MTNMISSGYVALDCGAIDIDWDNHYWRIFGINGALSQPRYVVLEYGNVRTLLGTLR